MNGRIGLRTWLIGVGVFALVIAISSLIEQGDVAFGIVDHQAAGTAQRVDEIQSNWREGRVRNLAIIAVIADLAWIWIYALGSFLVGRGFATKRQGMLRAIGLVIAAAAVVFGLTDYTETTLQLIQLLRDAGDDAMARTAAIMQPIKIASFLVAFFGVVLACVLDRFSMKSPSSAG